MQQVVVMVTARAACELDRQEGRMAHSGQTMRQRLDASASFITKVLSLVIKCAAETPQKLPGLDN